jgi:hypothetical protein
MNLIPTRDVRAEPAARASLAGDPHARADDLPAYLRVVSIILRSAFVVALTIVAARVSAPQGQGADWLDMPAGDIARVAIGAVFCLCMLRQAFRFPTDAGAHRTWLYLGLALAPLSIACVVAVW